MVDLEYIDCFQCLKRLPVSEVQFVGQNGRASVAYCGRECREAFEVRSALAGHPIRYTRCGRCNARKGKAISCGHCGGGKARSDG